MSTVISGFRQMPSQFVDSLDSDPVSDESLLEAIAEGQTRAFELLYDRYSPRLFGLALKILQNQSLAEDVIQEVFVSIWQKARRYQKGRGAPAAWLLTLCRNRSIDLLRSQASRNRRTVDMADDIQERLQAVAQNDPLTAVDAGQQAENIRTAMAQLPDEQRQIIEMSYFKGLSQTEIAADLQLPLGTVKTRTRLGMEKLRRILRITDGDSVG